MINTEKIRELIAERNVTSRELASFAGVSEAMMSYIVQGKREPNVKTLQLMACKLDVTVDELLTSL